MPRGGKAGRGEEKEAASRDDDDDDVNVIFLVPRELDIEQQPHTHSTNGWKRPWRNRHTDRQTQHTGLEDEEEEEKDGSSENTYSIIRLGALICFLLFFLLLLLLFFPPFFLHRVGWLSVCSCFWTAVQASCCSYVRTTHPCKFLVVYIPQFSSRNQLLVVIATLETPFIKFHIFHVSQFYIKSAPNWI